MYSSFKILSSNCDLKANSGFPNLFEVTEQSECKAFSQSATAKWHTSFWRETPASELQSEACKRGGWQVSRTSFLSSGLLFQQATGISLMQARFLHKQCTCTILWIVLTCRALWYSAILNYNRKQIVSPANKRTTNRDNRITTAFCVLLLSVHLATGQGTGHILHC